ncbi:MAG: GGDEF domain-containing protein [Lachnospiraceae bacterium]|nr:GGDEF domain-containing protein [Lachnospiraceae bacterium]
MILSLLPAILLLAVLIAVWLQTLKAWRSVSTQVEEGWTIETGRLSLPSLMLRVTGGDVYVYAGEEEILHSSSHAAFGGSLNGSRHLFVMIPEDAEGKVLDIRILIGEEEVNTLLENAYFGEYENLFRLFITEALPSMVVGSFMLLFGFVFLCLTVGFSLATEGIAEHVLGAIICIDLGLWLLATHGMGAVFLRAPYDTIVESFSSLLILPLLLMMLYFLRGAGSYLETGIWTFAACMGIYLIYAASESMYGVRMPDMASLLPIFGCLCLVVTLILNYYLNISSSYARQERYASLSEQAYIDALTSLPNRKSAENIFRTLKTVGDSYAIISMDLDNLKIINDTYGHDAGDEMLKACARVLNECFEEKAFRARMGGDEFVVIIKRASSKTLDALLAKVERRLKEEGVKLHQKPYGISHGYAFKEEVIGGNPQTVFELADGRMYTQKTAKKEATARMLSGRTPE